MNYLQYKNHHGYGYFESAMKTHPRWIVRLRDFISVYEIDEELITNWLAMECGLVADVEREYVAGAAVRRPYPADARLDRATQARLLDRLSCRECVELLRQIWRWVERPGFYEPNKK